MSTSNGTAPASTEARTTSVTLDAPDAAWFARALLAAAATDAVTPVICAALITVSKGRVEGISTDRYRVHSVFIEDRAIDGEGAYLVPREALDWIVKHAAYFGRGRQFDPAKVTLAFGDGVPGAVAITMSRNTDSRVISYADELVKGNFPPVYRLFETAEKAEITKESVTSINLGFLQKAQSIARDRHEPARFKYTTTDNPNKPGPLLLAFTSGRALIQPNLTVRDAA